MENKSELLEQIFSFLAEKLGTGERSLQKITGYREKCEIAYVKIFPEMNGSQDNKAGLVFCRDSEDLCIALRYSLSREDKDRNLMEIRLNESGGINICPGENSGMPRVMRIRPKHNKFEREVRSLAWKVALDASGKAYQIFEEKKQAAALPSI